MKIPFLDLSVDDQEFKNELIQAVDRVLTHGRILLGPEHDLFEKKVAEFCDTKYAVGVNSGTDALYLALRSLDIGPGDEVITTPLSWIATFNAISLCGATPVCVDVKDDLTINADLIPKAVTSKTKAILPVHFTGKMCEMGRILEIAAENNLFVIEDAAQAFGSRLKCQVAGSFGTVNCFSMNSMKVFNSYGEAGAIVTNDDNIHQKLVSLRYAGTVNREECHFPSINGRLDTIQAAMLLVNLKYLQKKIDRRREIAKFYTGSLNGVVVCPKEEEGYYNTYYTYTIIADRRNELQEYLTARGIETKIQHRILMPHQPAYKHLPKFNIPNAERLVNQILCIPANEKLTSGQTNYVVDCIKSFYNF